MQIKCLIVNLNPPIILYIYNLLLNLLSFYCSSLIDFRRLSTCRERTEFLSNNSLWYLSRTIWVFNAIPDRTLSWFMSTALSMTLTSFVKCAIHATSFNRFYQRKLCVPRKNWEFPLDNHFVCCTQFEHSIQFCDPLAWSISTTSHQRVWRLANNIATCILYWCILHIATDCAGLNSFLEQLASKKVFSLNIISQSRAIMFVFPKLLSKALGCHQIPTTIGDDLSRFRRSASPTTWSNLTFYDYQNHSLETIFEIEKESDNFCHSLYFLLDFCHLYYIPFIILLGLVGNLLSCVVFLKTHLKLRSSSYYLAALATTDFSFLMSLLLVWLNSTIGWKVFNNNGWCETLVYVSAVCSSLSVWLIVAFTVERFIAVQYPLHRPHMCTVARAKTIILVLTILALVSHSYSFVTAGVVKNQGGDEMCELKAEYWQTMRIISIIDSIASLIVPLVLIIVMNTMIMRNLLKFGRRFNQEPGYTTNCSNREKSDINLNQIPVSFLLKESHF